MLTGILSSSSCEKNELHEADGVANILLNNRSTSGESETMFFNLNYCLCVCLLTFHLKTDVPMILKNCFLVLFMH